MSLAQQKIDLKVTLAKLCVAYYHWRTQGFPDDHDYPMWVALFDSQLMELGREE